MPLKDKPKVNAVASLNARLKQDYSPVRLLALLMALGIISGILLKLLGDLINLETYGLLVTIAFALGIPLIALALIEGLRKLKWDHWLKRRNKAHEQNK